MSPTYKFLNEDGSPCHGGTGRYEVGVRREVEGPLVLRDNAIHACEEQDLSRWIGPALHPIQLHGEVHRSVDKVYARGGTIGPRLDGWTKQTARLCAADFAGRVEHLVRVRQYAAAIVIARAYAFGLVDNATRERAADAVWEVETGAGWGGEGYWSAREAARYAARWAPGRAAGRAASAAPDAEAERAWQGRRILAYAYGQIDLDACRRDTEAALPAALEAIA